MARRGGNPDWKRGGASPNPKGRPKGPTMPTIILRDAWVLAAQKAGGGGDDGVVNYLAEKAQTHPAAFISGLSRVIPLEIKAQGDSTLTIRIIKDFDDLKTIEHKPNGANGVNGNGRHHDPE